MIDSLERRVLMATVSGTVFNDLNANGVRDIGEPAETSLDVFMPRRSEYVVYQDGDPLVSVSSDGAFVFTVNPGTWMPLVNTNLYSEWVTTTLPERFNIQSQNASVSTTIGVNRVGSVRGTVFDDYDSNGIQNGAEPRLSQVFIAEGTRTDFYGQFLVTAKSGKPVTVALPLPSGYELTTPGALSRTTTPLPGQTIDVPAFGLHKVNTGKITGRIFFDKDANGVFSAGDEPFNVGLSYDAGDDGIIDASSMTDANGNYTIYNAPAGTRGSLFVGKGSYIPVLPTRFDVEVTNNQISQVDIPLSFTGVLGGYAFVDTNDDNLFEPQKGDYLMSQPIIYLDQNNNNARDPEEAYVVGNDGNYTFSYLVPGTYRPRLVLPLGWTQGNTQLLDTFTVVGRQFTPTVLIAKPPRDIIQSESATLTGGTVRSASWPNFTGTGYADYAGQNSGVSYAITRTIAGLAKLDFRYANGGGVDRPLQIFVNNALVGTLPFAPTGAWNKWAVASLNNINLPTGVVTIRAVASTVAGGANVDALTITPVAPPVLGSISGTVFSDTNKNGLFDTGEARLANRVVFIDLDNDNILDSNERRILTDASGNFRFDGLTAGTYKIRRVLPTGFRVTTPVADVTLTPGQIFSNVLIGAAN